jgi:cell division protein FtsI (penicillin-binding protein 3)
MPPGVDAPTRRRPASTQYTAPQRRGPKPIDSRDPRARRPAPPPSRLAPRVGDPRRRHAVTTLASLVVLVVFAAKLVDVQILNAAPLAQQALDLRLVTTTVTPPRADIVDRNGIVLATSVDRYHLAVNQQKLATWKRVTDGQVLAEGPLDAARILSPIVGIGEAELAAKLVGDKTYAYVLKNITPEMRASIKAEGIAGIEFEPTSERVYPNGAIAGNVIGFMGGREDKQGVWGLAGVEREYEELLMGEPGSSTYERSRYGTVIPTGVRSDTPAVPGTQVQLTIDRDIQYESQAILEKHLRNTGARQGVVVVSDARTGEILALADSGSVDPNDPGATPAANRGSRAVSDVFEPGSTAKVVTMAAALEEGVATPESRFVAPYQYTTANNQTFRDSHEHADQKLTLAGVLVSSSNTGTIQIGQQLSDETRYSYMRAFGLGAPTNVGLPGESAGILHPWDEWDGRTKYATMYGQGVSSTALQTAQVYQTIANGGVKVQPSIIKSFIAPDGTVTEPEAAASEQVISADTAKQLMLMLESVTQEGTGRLARIEGYRVAGKTGTAQAADGHGGLTSIVASFVGIAPADNPRIVVTVILYDPKSSIWGGDVAAPVFKDVATFALQSLRVPPSSSTETFYPTTWE